MNVILFKSEMVGEPWCSIKPGITMFRISKIFQNNLWSKSILAKLNKNILRIMQLVLVHLEGHQYLKSRLAVQNFKIVLKSVLIPQKLFI